MTERFQDSLTRSEINNLLRVSDWQFLLINRDFLSRNTERVLSKTNYKRNFAASQNVIPIIEPPFFNQSWEKSVTRKTQFWRLPM